MTTLKIGTDIGSTDSMSKAFEDIAKYPGVSAALLMDSISYRDAVSACMKVENAPIMEDDLDQPAIDLHG